MKLRTVRIFENCEIFCNLHFSYVRDYKVTLASGNKKIQLSDPSELKMNSTSIKLISIDKSP